MSGVVTRNVTLERRGPAGAIVLSDDEVASLGGGRKTFPVIVTIGDRHMRLRLARMGGENLIGFSKQARADAGVDLDDSFDAEIAVDDEPRAVEVPDDLTAALSVDAIAGTAFEALAPSHKKEYVRWITDAKRQQTRADRIVKAVEMLREGKTR